uniref:Uncharacterized protein n=1 Tax=Arundo donax TaxID=35708 RepID=A0A0A9AY13_ARUDO
MAEMIEFLPNGPVWFCWPYHKFDEPQFQEPWNVLLVSPSNLLCFAVAYLSPFS